MRSIVLTGFMGVGKSTIGRKVAEHLNLPFVDLDRQIEAASGKSIPDLFAESEQRFRWWEQQTLATLTWETPFVLATGGGALIGAWNHHLVADATIIVLDAALETVQSRLAEEGGRPLAANSAALYERRRAIYERIPLHIATDGCGVNEIVAQVVEMAEAQDAGRGTQDSAKGGSSNSTEPPLQRIDPPAVGMQDAETATHPLAPSQEGETAFSLPLSVNVGRGIASMIGERVASLNPTGVAIITDATIGQLWGEQVRHDILGANLPATVIEVPAGEAHKTLATISTIYDRLLEAGIDRGGVVVALGGGVIGDMAGFTAATWMRGVKGFVQLPTTLLAMVDASIGGKTGVDHPKGKNLIGAFRQPDFILADPDFLTTLPVREWRSGLAEVIKHGIIADPALFAMLKATPPRDPPQPNDPEAIAIITEWLARAIRVKTDIVQRDPYEQSERARLNLGHTFGHAYETLSGFALAHGEAVAIGMVTAARLSERLGLAQPGLTDEIIAVLAGVGLPTAWRDAPAPDIIWQAMQSDKKKAGKGLRLVLPRAIGDVIVTEPGEIAKEDVLNVLRMVD